MIKITKPEDLEKIHDENIKPYIAALLGYILKEYSPDSSTNEIGAIFLLESESDYVLSDYVLYEEMGLSMPLSEKRFEWIEPVEHDYYNGTIVIDNDRAINIIGRKEYFEKFTEDTEQ